MIIKYYGFVEEENRFVVKNWVWFNIKTILDRLCLRTRTVSDRSVFKETVKVNESVFWNRYNKRENIDIIYTASRSG